MGTILLPAQAALLGPPGRSLLPRRRRGPVGCRRGSEPAAHGRACERSQGTASEQQELALSPRGMPQRRVSPRTLAAA